MDDCCFWDLPFDALAVSAILPDQSGFGKLDDLAAVKPPVAGENKDDHTDDGEDGVVFV